MKNYKIEKGLIIREPWASMIVEGKKIIEIRGMNTKTRGEIAIIAASTGKIVGVATLTEVIGPLSLEEYNSISDKRVGEEKDTTPYKNTYGWLLTKPEKFDIPVPYKHPHGAVIWVNLKESERDILNDRLQ